MNSTSTLHQKLRYFGVLIALLLPLSVAADNKEEASTNDLTVLNVTSSSFRVDTDNQQRMLTTLGSLKNTGDTAFEELVVEVKSFDRDNRLIDTVVQPLYGVVAPPQREVNFRVRDVAARSADAYSSQTISVTSATPRVGYGSRSKSRTDGLMQLVTNWLPIIGFAVLLFLLVKRGERRGGPQQRMITLIEQQITIHQQHNAQLERIAQALEKRNVSN